MKRIFAIGGGEIADADTRTIDEAVVAAASGETPRALFLPTASEDSEGYVERFEEYYGDDLGCSTDVVRIAGNGHEERLEDRIRSADLVYVGGGNTGYMLDVFRTRGVDDVLRAAWRDGTVMAGLSAGALCWFEGGIADRPGLESGSYGPIHGLGVVPSLHAAVHVDQDARRTFGEYLGARDANGVAFEDETALEVRGDEWRVHAATENGFAYHVSGQGEGIDVEPLPADGEYRPLADLV